MGCKKLSTNYYEKPRLRVVKGSRTLFETQVGNFQKDSRRNLKSSVDTVVYYYGARYYDPKVSNWLSVDPIALYDPINETEHYLDGQHNGGYYNPRNTSVYGYTYQNPILYVDPNGKQSVSHLLFPDSFNTNNTYKGNAGAYTTTTARSMYYGWVHKKLESKGMNMQWFKAAESVTSWNAIGGMKFGELADATSSFTDESRDWVFGGNSYLLPRNIAVASSLFTTGGVSGSFTDPNGNKQTLTGLSGNVLDMKLVELEQTHVQNYINKTNPSKAVLSQVSNLFSDKLTRAVGPSAINSVMDSHFDGGSSFDFGNYNHRVTLGQEVIKILRTESNE